MTPYSFQRDGALFLKTRTTALLADEQGLGKSAQALFAVRDLKLARVLIVCPSVAIPVWRAHVHEILARQMVSPAGFSDTLSQTVTLSRVVVCLSYAHLSIPKKSQALAAVLASTWDLVIFDEAQALKDLTAARTKTAYIGDQKLGRPALIAKCRRAWLLSGTPVPNHRGELYPHLWALFRDQLISHGIHTKQSFDDAFLTIHKIRVGRNTGHPRMVEKVVGVKNTDLFRSIVHPVMLRRMKADVLPDLPPRRYGVIPLDIELPEHLSGPLRSIEASDEPHRYAGQLATQRRELGILKVNPAADYLTVELENNPTERLVVFAWHNEVITALLQRLAPFNPVAITGATPEKDRGDLVARFQDLTSATRVFIGNIQAAGTAITLTAASRLFFVEQSWVPADMAQAADRVHRIGQQDSVLVQTFVTADQSPDHAITKTLYRKMRDIKSVLN